MVLVTHGSHHGFLPHKPVVVMALGHHVSNGHRILGCNGSDDIVPWATIAVLIVEPLALMALGIRSSDGHGTCGCNGSDGPGNTWLSDGFLLQDPVSAMAVGPVAARVLIAPVAHGSDGCDGPGTPWL